MKERPRTTVRLAWQSVVVLGLLSFAVIRCAPPDQCLRISDCARGMTCLDGECVPADGDPSSETTAIDAASAVTDASSNVTRDASTGSSTDASDADVADSGSSDADVADSGDEEDLTDF